MQSAGALASGLVAIAVLFEIVVGGDDRDLGSRLVMVLVALGALCVVGLTVRRKPSVAWIAATLSAGLAAIEIIALSRARSGPAGDGAAPLIVVVAVARLTTMAIALGYPLSRREAAGRRSAGVVRLAVAAVGIGAVVVEAVAAAAALQTTGTNPFSIWPERFANRVTFGVAVAAVTLGAALDMRGPMLAARRRLDAEASADGAPSHGVTMRRGAHFIGLLIDELLPERMAARRALVELERARLAADLHAAVLPELRSALASAHDANVPPGVGHHLESAVGTVEDLMTIREPVIVEASGLLPALGWLAERTQMRGEVEVLLDIAPASAAEPADRPPLAVERAAFRVAQLALDNVVRHAGPATVVVAVASGPDHLAISVADDGRGFDPRRSSPGRGLRDMRLEADAVSASLTVTGGTGTLVQFEWRRRSIA